MKSMHSINQNTDDAYTLIETAITLAVLAILGLLGFYAVSSSRSVSSSFLLRGQSIVRIIALKNDLHSLLADVSPPFWTAPDSSVIPTSDPNTIKIPYYKGKLDSCITLNANENFLYISCPDKSKRYGPFYSITIKPQYSSSNMLIGITTTINDHGQKVVITSSFSSIQFPRREH